MKSGYEARRTLPEPVAELLGRGCLRGEVLHGVGSGSCCLEELCETLEADGIPYAIAGAMALNAYGYRRVTVDVDVLLTADGLAAFKAKHLGRGWVERFPGMRDTEFNVKIDILLAGDYPGDGNPKPVAFPDLARDEARNRRRVLSARSPV